MADHLEKRYAHFTETDIKDIDIEGYQLTGNPDAPVIMAAYFSANCPLGWRMRLSTNMRK